MSLITLPDGRVFPEYEGKPLSWDIGCYNSWNEEQAGYPKAKAVLAEMSAQALELERREMVKASFDRMFGHNTKKMLDLIEAEIKRRGAV